MMRKDDQLDFFANTSGPAAPRKAGLEAAPPKPEHVALAERLPERIWLGTSSWNFPSWQGIVYGSQATSANLAQEGLRAYSQHPLLRAVGVDRTHYHPIERELYADFASQVPEHFRFLVKAHDHLTLTRFPEHDRYGALRGQVNARFLDAAYAITEVVQPFVEGLGAKAGPLVFQFAPQEYQSVGGPEGFAGRLHGFLAQLPRGPLYAVELRNPELMTQAYAEALRDTGVCHCFNSWGRMPPPSWQVGRVDTRSMPALVARWMVPRGSTYEESYRRFFPYTHLQAEDLPARRGLAELARRAHAAGKPAFITVDNKAEGCSPESVFKLAQAIVEG